MDTVKCPVCGNPRIGLIKDGSEYFLKKHKQSGKGQCLGSFKKVDK